MTTSLKNILVQHLDDQILEQTNIRVRFINLMAKEILILHRKVDANRQEVLNKMDHNHKELLVKMDTIHYEL